MKFLDYIRGVRKGKEARRIEYDAMSDPFLSDAIEGYDSVVGNHVDSIERMRTAIAAKSSSRKPRSGAWKVAVAAVALIAAVTGYFSLLNHRSSMVTASCDNCFIDIYAPEDYIERKRLELTLMQEQDPSQEVTATAIVNIENLKEIIKPVERINVYLPDSYAQMKNSDLEELHFYEKKQASKKESLSDLNSIAQSQETAIEPQRESENKKSKNVSAYYANSQSSFGIVGDISEDKFDSVHDDSPLLAAEDINRYASEEKVSSSTTAYLKADGVERSKSRSVMKPQTPVEKDMATASFAKKSSTPSGLAENMNGAKLSESYNAGLVGSINQEPVLAPHPLIGYDKYKEYLRTNLVRPVAGKCADMKGKVVVEFSVGKNGKPKDIRVLKSLCADADKEAIRLIKSGSDWTFSTKKVKVEVLF